MEESEAIKSSKPSWRGEDLPSRPIQLLGHNTASRCPQSSFLWKHPLFSSSLLESWLLALSKAVSSFGSDSNFLLGGKTKREIKLSNNISSMQSTFVSTVRHLISNKKIHSHYRVNMTCVNTLTKLNLPEIVAYIIVYTLFTYL